MYMTGLDSTGQETYNPWGTPALHDFDIWKPQPDERIGRPLWSTALPTGLPQEADWQVPQKLDVQGTDSVMPMSSWASPLRVPLPDPVVEEQGLEQSLNLEPEPASAGYAAFMGQADEAALSIQPPPGLANQSLAPTPSPEVELPPGMTLCTSDIAGKACTRVEWRIEDLYGKLQASMGRPLVSPPFAALGLPNLRLMVFPDGKDTMKNARSGERKGLYAAMIKKGPLHGALKLKADCLQCATVMTVNLTVGKIRSGPLVYNFSEQAIHGLDDFGADWLKQVDKASGSLTVGIEILDVRSQTL